MAYRDDSSMNGALYTTIRVVWYLLGFVEVLLIFRFALKLFAANPLAGFSTFVYRITQPLALPFISVFRVQAVQGSVFEWTTLLAMLVYWCIAWAIVRLLLISRPVSTAQAKRKLDEEE